MTSEGPQHLTIGAGQVYDGLGGGGQQIFARMPRDRTGHGVVEAGDDLTGRAVPDRRAGCLALRQRLAVPPFMGRDAGAVRRHRKTEEPELRLTSQRLCPDEGEGVDRPGIDLLLSGQATLDGVAPQALSIPAPVSSP